MALLDTTALIDLTRSPKSSGNRAVVAVVNRLLSAGQSLLTSRINEAEFRVGVFRSTDPIAEAVKVEAVLARMLILEFDALAAIEFASIQALALDAGRPIGEADTMIAAVAITNGQTIVTRNGREFSTVSGLTVLTY